MKLYVLSFFLYLAHSMPHVPSFASEDFLGTSKRGLYGDVIEEIDWSVGQIVETLQTEGLANNTLVVFTSDNGPWLLYRHHGGSAGPLYDGKGTTWEGGCAFLRFSGGRENFPEDHQRYGSNMKSAPTTRK